MKKVHIAKNFTTTVNGKLRTEEDWCRIEDERIEREREAEREARLEAEEADMVWYEGRMVTSLYREEMLRW